MAFAELPLAPSNLDRDSTVPVWRPFRRHFWPPDPRPTIRDGGGARGLSIEALLATNAQE